MSKPNYLFIMTDEERYAPVYETDEIKSYRKTFKGMNEIQRDSATFLNHYTSGSACAPSRTSIMTGQNISIHKMRNINGVTSGTMDVTWLDADYLPTVGSYFKTEGYDTCYVGKWHISDENIIDFNGNPVPLINQANGTINETLYKSYVQDNRLGQYGFDHWIRSDPYIVDSEGKFRDPISTGIALEWVQNRPDPHKPFILIVSYINPHDIVFYTKDALLKQLILDPNAPIIPPSPNESDNLSTKPSIQKVATDLYPKYLAHL